jgi:hypothetical protein
MTSSRVCQRRPSNQPLRPSRMRQSADCGRSNTVRTYGQCTVFEIVQDPDHLRPGHRIVDYPKFLDKLNGILFTGDIGLDPNQSRCPAYAALLTKSLTCPVDSRQIMLPECENPMATRSGKFKNASSARGLRPAAGSGQMDTCVANSNPP